MSTVPYIFANKYGNIALSELDANFANVKANVDFATSAATANFALTATTASTANTATTATTATTAGTVTTAAQPNITSVGTLLSLNVSGNAAANAMTANAMTANAINTDTLSANIVNTLEVVGDLRGSVFADDSTMIVDAVDNHIMSDTSTFGSTSVTGNLTAGGAITLNGLEIVSPQWLGFLTNSSITLSNTTSYNMLYGKDVNLTITVDMPINPVEGQITRLAVNGNALNLVLGNGNVTYDFSGVNQPGNNYTYIYTAVSDWWARTA
jgi:hypothetical protein